MSLIELTNVEKIYGSGLAQTTALKNVNFVADQGQVVLIMGPSGAGKSTLLTIIGALQKPTSGQVLLNGQDITKLSDRKRDQLRLNEIGFVLQSYNLVPYLTVQDQFKLVAKVKKQGNLDQAQLTNLLQELGISQLVNKYPGELSGGQQQRVAIARAIYANPQLVLADEPTASLDSARVHEVGQLFRQLATKNQKAILLVTHDPRLEEYADSIYQMMDGQLTKVK